MEKERYAIRVEPSDNNHEIKFLEYIFGDRVADIEQITQEMIIPKDAFLISLYKCIERFNSFDASVKGLPKPRWQKDFEIAKEALHQIGIEV